MEATMSPILYSTPLTIESEAYLTFNPTPLFVFVFASERSDWLTTRLMSALVLELTSEGL